jgi:hypothetical protein
MRPTFEPTRLTGFAILAVAAATALSVGACSSSNNNAKSPATSSKAPGAGKDLVTGLIASVSGNAVQVNQKSGTATVDVSPKTKVTEFTTAQLTDVTAGSCVNVVSKPASNPGGPVTAKSVQLNPQGSDGKCPQPKNGQPRKVIGTVASVTGNTINVNVTDGNGNPAETTVTVTDTTRYSKHASSTSQAIAQGKCITAHGKKNSGGTLQATAVTLGPAENGQCPEPAAEQHPH